ncbi:nuclear transport factor 2 family protein [Salipiger sp. P9]|uniref:nuclear transport factor 2 family protein n=1 Tax=Salipiger pentaromativorans TaxID=2943193 RepID=UPI00215774E7|nr:nuclear transport factor 2 family protein [Salipiger pentaromativorans]MCR8546304.1 nuclear transport factor 2 family protein [Salipiger pentaromativorans]
MLDVKDPAAPAETLARRFIDHIFAGDMARALEMVAPEAQLIPARAEASDANPMFGRFTGPEGAAEFFGRFGTLLEPQAFEIAAGFGDDTHACLFGQLRHRVRATGKPFASDWALVTEWRAGRLVLYHFYEDTAALADAMAV